MEQVMGKGAGSELSSGGCFEELLGFQKAEGKFSVNSCAFFTQLLQMLVS